jgi:hypothetical protein
VDSDANGARSNVAAEIRTHPGIASIVVFAGAAGIALLLAIVFHQGVAALSTAFALLVPGLFLAYLQVRLAIDAPQTTPGLSPSPVPGANSTRKPVRLADPPTLLAGRDDVLAELDSRLSGGDGSVPITAALCGVGGVGKTSVATAYAHRHLAEVAVAWQFGAEDRAVLAAGFSELAGQLGARVADDIRDPVASVHAVLALLPDAWLLVFDNAPDRVSLEGFLPPAGRGRVLITSQSQHWPHGQALQVPVLHASVGATFLLARTGDSDSHAATVLATDLDGLPLALEQAAAYMEAATVTIAAYVRLFRERRAAMLKRGEAAGHPMSVAATLTLASQRLEADAPAAAGLLRLLACLSPEPVPLTLLLASPGRLAEFDDDAVHSLLSLVGDPVALADAVSALRRYSLVNSSGDGTVIVHRLVQAVMLDGMTARQAAAYGEAAAALIEASIPSDVMQPANWAECAALLPHARAVLDPTSGGLARIATYLGESGSYSAARDVFEQIAYSLERSHVYGAEHPDTLTARHRRAAFTGKAGDHGGARDQLAALLVVEERVLGPEHHDTLATRNELAGATGYAGDYAGARDQLAALLPVQERVLGPEHNDTLATRNSLASFTGHAGDYAGARDQLAALLPVQERVLGPENHETLATRHQLASFTGHAGDYAGARDRFAAQLLVIERVLGSRHHDTLATRHELALFTGRAGDYAAARDQFAALLPVMEEEVGADHPNTLATRHQLAISTGRAGNAAAARDQLAALLPVEERVLGPDHPTTLTTRHALATSTGRSGNAAAARDQLAALLPDRERVLGPEHPNTLITGDELAYWAGEADREMR